MKNTFRSIAIPVGHSSEPDSRGRPLARDTARVAFSFAFRAMRMIRRCLRLKQKEIHRESR